MKYPGKVIPFIFFKVTMLRQAFPCSFR